MQAVFGEDENLAYLGGSMNLYPDPVIGEFIRTFAPFGDSRVQSVGAYKAAFEKSIAAAGDKRIVLSDEILSSIGFATHGQSNSPTQIVDNLTAVIPGDIELVLVIRRQQDFIRSYYRQWVLQRGVLSFPDFVELVMMRRNRFLWPVLNYPNLVRALRSQVGAVHVLPFERIFSDREYGVARLGPMGLGASADRFVGRHERPGKTDEVIAETREGWQGVMWTEKFRSSRLSAYPDIYVNRKIETPGALSLLKRITQFEQRQKQLAEGAAAPHPTADFDDPKQQARFEDAIRRFNARLNQVDPDEDWAGLGYLL